MVLRDSTSMMDEILYSPSTHKNLSPAALLEHALALRQGALLDSGAFVTHTTPHTGRSPNDKYIVNFPAAQPYPIWRNATNRFMSIDQAAAIEERLLEHLSHTVVYMQDASACSRIGINQPLRIFSESPWHCLFARNLLLPGPKFTSMPPVTVLHAPTFKADPSRDGTRSEVFVILDISRKFILIGGTAYAGEVKKAIFTYMNYFLPSQGIFSMHCSANVGASGDVALYFGLSGTGKTTLSSDPDRLLVGDDEHGWDDAGIFNIEGGCYAKAISLDRKLEPLIWAATNRFGAILENVVYDEENRIPDFNSDSITENTRSAYPLTFIKNIVPQGTARAPKHIFFLTADAFGILPPIARLSLNQAIYYFLSGYTAKLAGTEKDLGKEPQATFSTCFGEPFLPLHPQVYAALLGEKIQENHTHVWLVNTGWTGGKYGIGNRIPLPYTRAMISAALEGKLTRTSPHRQPFFNLDVPSIVPGVPSRIMNARDTWLSKNEYDEQAGNLVRRFMENFKKYTAELPSAVEESGPQL